jgi:hypothetical protein
MKTFYQVTLIVFVIGLAVLCGFAPWTSAAAESSAAHNLLGYAPIWSRHFVSQAGAHVDLAAFAMLVGVVAFFAVVIGGAAFFFRDRRGSERADV